MTAPAWPFLYSVRAGRIVRNGAEFDASLMQPYKVQAVAKLAANQRVKRQMPKAQEAKW